MPTHPSAPALSRHLQGTRSARTLRRALSRTAPLALLLSLAACAEAPSSTGVGEASQPLSLLPDLVSVSGEVALGAPVSGPAAGLQTRPGVAWNGTHYLVVWQDDRSGGSDLWVTRAAADGTLLDPVGTLLIKDAEDPVVSSDGTDFLVVYGRANGTLEAAHVSATGALLSQAAIPGGFYADYYKYRIAFDGQSYVIAWADSNLYYARVSPQGAVLGPGAVSLGPGYEADVAFDGTSTLLVTNDFTDHARILGRRLSPQGILLDAEPFVIASIDDGATAYQGVGVGCTSSQCTVAYGTLYVTWIDAYSTIEAVRITPQGTVLDPQPIVVLDSQNHSGDPQEILVGNDGEDAVLVWQLGYDDDSLPPAGLYTAHLPAQATSAGSIVTLAERDTTPGIHAVLASGGPSPLVTWSDQRDEYNGVYEAHDLTGVRLGASGPVGTPFVVSGAPDQRHPSVAFDGQSFVVAWSDGRNGRSGAATDIVAARVSSSGSVLDPQGLPLPTASFGWYNAWDVRPRVATDGEKAVVGWVSCNGSDLEPTCVNQAARVSPAGAVLDTSPLNPQMLLFGRFDARTETPPALLSGDSQALFVDPFDLAWSSIDQAGQVTSSFVTDEWFPFHEGGSSLPVASASDGTNHLVVRAGYSGGLEGARLSPGGDPLDDPPWFPIVPAGGAVQSATVAFDGAHYVVVWHDAAGPAPRILAARVAPDGTVVDAPPVTVSEHAGCAAMALDTQGAAHSGHRTFVAWQACGASGPDLFGATLDDDLGVSTFRITDDAYPDRAPALAADGDKLLAVYSSYRAAAPLAAERVYGRVLTDIPAVGCSMQGGSAGNALPLAGLGLLALVAQRRRRSR
ncbi:MYXO-CTERM sorting domain-containing protein [Chondromyces apiculatus]|uniref:Uncharacterized protein n=1 Tax=Chondromyces apiculatus DSM 436 TaxID=1192034 RepID=A0A017T084_9BACT|nr:MYXO-CTERM sorting domain-containing protein [Chondromyces apiculatus]EYF01961.1 Hypothetical protein CAP_7579 [Chondromyces apiculatus DSM 436]